MIYSHESDPQRLRPAHGRGDQVRGPADLAGVAKPSGGNVGGARFILESQAY